MENKDAFPSDVADKVLVRMPDGMRDKLKAAAKASKRTMNAEIVARLEESLEGPHLGFGPGSVGERLQQAKRELDEAVVVKQETIQEITKQVTELVYQEFLKRAAAEGLTALIQKPKT